MNTAFTIEQAYELLKQYNKDPFHLRHGRTVEGVMRYFARELGSGQWSVCCTIWISSSIRRSIVFGSSS